MTEAIEVKRKRANDVKERLAALYLIYPEYRFFRKYDHIREGRLVENLGLVDEFNLKKDSFTQKNKEYFLRKIEEGFQEYYELNRKSKVVKKIKTYNEPKEHESIKDFQTEKVLLLGKNFTFEELHELIMGNNFFAVSGFLKEIRKLKNIPKDKKFSNGYSKKLQKELNIYAFNDVQKELEKFFVES